MEYMEPAAGLPGRLSRPPDPNASPKPTWDDLILGARQYRLWKYQYETDQWLDYTSREDKPVVAEAILTDAVGAHVGTGLDGMTALLQIVEHSNLAGKRHSARRDAR